MEMLLSLVWIFLSTTVFSNQIFCRKFSIDNDNSQFLLDGKPFRYVSGSMHYFRVPHEYWLDRLNKMRMAGVNALTTYVEWASHEPFEGEYRFDGDLNLVKFLDNAKEADLLVLLRIGPYICAERDLGGLPHWLLNRTENLRTSDPSYLESVETWLRKLLPMIEPYLYRNNGPVIMVQIENEYGSYPACDFEYTSWLQRRVTQDLGRDVVLYTTDGWYHEALKCGIIDETLTTIDFGVEVDPRRAFANLRAHQRRGPLVNSEFYPGWLDQWSQPHQRRDDEKVVAQLNEILDYNASVNFYMFHGGTSFGLSSGANWNQQVFLPQPTSYDYDSPLDEAGDPTEKYFKLRESIGRYLPLPAGNLPRRLPKQSIGPVYLSLYMDFFQLVNNSALKTVSSVRPLSFEQLGARNGFVIYSTKINFKPTVPSVLKVDEIRDRGYVFVDWEFQGILSRMEHAKELPIRAKKFSKIIIIVENQGRINYGPRLIDFKGLLGNVVLGSLNLTHWHHAFIPDWEAIFAPQSNFRPESTFQSSTMNLSSPRSVKAPAFLRAEFFVDRQLDTYLNPVNFTKGVAYVNGRCLGRYWPSVGPQITLYTPGVWLNPYPKTNELILFELEPTSCIERKDCVVSFIKNAILDSETPTNLLLD